MASTDKNIFYKFLTCSALISILFSLGILEHFILGRMGMGGIFPSAESWSFYDVSHVHTETLRLVLFPFFPKSVSFYEIHKK